MAWIELTVKSSGTKLDYKRLYFKIMKKEHKAKVMIPNLFFSYYAKLRSILNYKDMIQI